MSQKAKGLEFHLREGQEWGQRKLTAKKTHHKMGCRIGKLTEVQGLAWEEVIVGKKLRMSEEKKCGCCERLNSLKRALQVFTEGGKESGRMESAGQLGGEKRSK